VYHRCGPPPRPLIAPERPHRRDVKPAAPPRARSRHRESGPRIRGPWRRWGGHRPAGGGVTDPDRSGRCHPDAEPRSDPDGRCPGAESRADPATVARTITGGDRLTGTGTGDRDPVRTRPRRGAADRDAGHPRLDPVRGPDADRHGGTPDRGACADGSPDAAPHREADPDLPSDPQADTDPQADRDRTSDRGADGSPDRPADRHPQADRCTDRDPEADRSPDGDPQAHGHRPSDVRAHRQADRSPDRPSHPEADPRTHQDRKASTAVPVRGRTPAWPRQGQR
jgi:hypothetical protein